MMIGIELMNRVNNIIQLYYIVIILLLHEKTNIQ